MVNYDPLFKTLKEKDIGKTYLRKVVDGATVAKLSKNEFVSLQTIAKICLLLDVPIEKVVKINRIKQK